MILIISVLMIVAIAVGLSALVTSSMLRGHGPALREIPDPQTEERLRRMEATLDALTAEMERMSEGQRFLTEVLSERRGGEKRLPPSPPNQER